MSDDLVKRLRDIASVSNDGNLRGPALTAADRIEELEAENKRLETEAKLQAEEIDKTRRRSDKWESMIRDCEECLKPGETPRQRMDRDHADVLGLMKLLEKEKRKSEQLEAERDTAYKRGLLEAAKIVDYREAMIAGWNACRKSLYAVCEDVQENDAKRLGGHWGAGMAHAAKSIARGFGAMKAEDDDNLLAAIRAKIQELE